MYNTDYLWERMVCVVLILRKAGMNMNQERRGRKGTPPRKRGRSKYAGKFSPRMQGTLLTVFAVIILLFFALIVRIGNLTKEKGDRYGKRALSQQTYVSNVIEYKRGDILDRNNTKLATSQLLYNVVVSPKELLEDKECGDATIKAVCTYFSLEESEFRSNISERSGSQYYVVAKNVPKADKDAYDNMVEKEKERSKAEKDDMRINKNAVYFEKIYKRNYPLNDTACNVIGFSSAGNAGLWGLEYQYNDELNGVTGRSANVTILRRYGPPLSVDVVLTFAIFLYPTASIASIDIRILSIPLSTNS